MAKLLGKKPELGLYLRRAGKALLHYHRSPVFWIRAMDFEPNFKSATRTRSEDHLRDLSFGDHQNARTVGAVLNSSCFFFWFISQGNCRDVAGPDVTRFHLGAMQAELQAALSSGFKLLMTDLMRNRRRRVYNYEASGRVEYDEFYPNKSKGLIDEIDLILAKHYGFTDEELDFIINYDIKYRIGRDAGEDEQP